MKRTITLRYLFTLCVMTLISAFCGGNLASAEDFTFDISLGESRDAKSVSKGDVKIDMSKAYWYGTWSEVRAYSSSTITFTCTNASKVIKNIAFQYKSGTISTSTGGSFTTPNSVWESGDADYQTVIFTVGGSYYKFTGVTVTLAEKSTASEDITPTIEFNSNTWTLDCKESCTVVAVAKEGGTVLTNGDISYEISPEGDYKFNKETGEFVAGLSGGEYTVTATYTPSNGTTGYKSTTNTCTITVADPGVSSSKAYRLVTSQNQILDGAQYLLVTSYENNGWTYKEAMSNTFAEGYASGESVSYYTLPSNDGFEVNAENIALPITLEKVGNYYALKTKYGYVTGEAGTYYILYSKTCNEALAQWNIVIDEGNAKIYNVYNQEQALMYNSTAFQFKNYAVSNYGKDVNPAVQLYAKSAEMSISQDALGYGTYAVNFAYQMPAGVKGYAIAGLETENKLKKVEAYSAGAIVPALTPLLVYSEEATAASKMFYPIVVNKDVDSYEEENYLEYKRVSGMTASKKDGDVYYYKLTKNEDKPLGFYWGAVDGAAFSMTKSSSAYLALPQRLSAAAGLLFDEAGEATGIQLTPAGETAAPAVYNLQGVRVSGKLAKGLYIVNGKKVLVK